MDFVLDALSPDERAEWYSMQATRLEPLLSIDKRPNTIKTCIEILSEFNINVIGIASAETMGSDQELLVDGTYIDPLYRHQSLDKPLPSNCYVICAARNNWSFRLARPRYVLSRAANLVPGITTRPGSVVQTNDSSISPPEPVDHRVLIVGSSDQGAKLSEFMKRSIGRTADVMIIDGKETLHDVEQQVSALRKDQPWTHVVIMALQVEANARNKSSRVDAQTILRTHLIQGALAKEGMNPLLVAEILNVDNRQMFEEAQIDVVVPTMITMERILARMAAGQGLVSTMLTSLISREDGIFLDSIQLPRKHPLVGQRFSDAITNYFEDGRVLAVLPTSQRKRLENECDDFRTHFVMCPSRQPIFLAAGDVLILLRHA